MFKSFGNPVFHSKYASFLWKKNQYAKNYIESVLFSQIVTVKVDFELE